MVPSSPLPLALAHEAFPLPSRFRWSLNSCSVTPYLFTVPGQLPPRIIFPLGRFGRAVLSPLLLAMPDITSHGRAGIKQERMTYLQTAAECQDGPGQLPTCTKIARGGAGMKQERGTYLLNRSRMLGRAGTSTKLH